MLAERSPAAAALAELISGRRARICIVGLGYVGLPTAVAFAAEGFEVIGVDADETRVTQVNAARSYIGDVTSEDLSAQVTEGRLRAVRSLQEAAPVDVVDICVPTPLDKSRDPDMSAILAVTQELQDVLRSGQLVILTSTTYPGTTLELLQPILDRAGLTVGEDAFLAFAPERIDPGNPHYGIRNTPKVVGGISDACTELARLLFEAVVDKVVPVTSPTAAEMTKLMENTFRSVNIALANEFAIMCRHLGVDVWEVVEAAATKPYGFMPFYPGPGLGGHCIPVDPSYLSWKLRRLDYVARFIDLAEDINHHMPDYVVKRVVDILNDEGMSVKNARILLLGVAYKRNVGDLRESPALDLISQLRRRGAVVTFADPHVVGPIEVDGADAVAEGLTQELIAQQDLVVVTTDHAGFDWDLIRCHASLVLDTRGVAHARGIPEWHTL